MFNKLPFLRQYSRPVKYNFKPSFYNILFSKKNNGLFLRKWVNYISQFYFNQRLKFKYPDMTIYTSQYAMINFFNSLQRPGKLNVIETNINMEKKVKERISSNAFKLLSKPNAGGSSIYSEALSIELLSRLLGVQLYKTETELTYEYPENNGPILDYACHYLNPSQEGEILTLGVSVTRAMTWNQKNLQPDDAYRLLNKKLSGLIQSSKGVSDDSLNRFILHIWTESGKNSTLIKKVCRKLELEYGYKNVIVLISIINNNFIFFNNNRHLSFIP